MRPAKLLLQLAMLSMTSSLLWAETEYDVTGVHLMCADFSQACQRPHLSFHLKTTPFSMKTAELSHWYSRVFGAWNCSFFANRKQEYEQDKQIYHLTYCTDNTRETADGYFRDEGKEYYVYHDWSSHQQHLVIADPGWDERSLQQSAADDSLTDIVVEPQEDMENPTTKRRRRRPSNKRKFMYAPSVYRLSNLANSLSEPMVELAVFADDLFLRHVGNDAIVAEITAHQLALGATAIFQTASTLSLSIKRFRVMRPDQLDCVFNQTTTYNESLYHMFTCFGDYPTNRNLKEADLEPDQMRGIPDIMLILTNRRHAHTEPGTAGISFRTGMCKWYGFAIVSLPNPYTGFFDSLFNQHVQVKRPRLHVQACTTLAHEIGHTLNLSHYNPSECRCDSNRGDCIMHNSTVTSSHTLTECSLQLLRQRLSNARRVSDCLMQTDLFESKEDVVVPMSHAVAGALRYWDIEKPDINLHSRYLPDFRRVLRYSYEVLLSKGQFCRYFIHRSKWGRTFAAFEGCNNQTRDAFSFTHRGKERITIQNRDEGSSMYHRFELLPRQVTRSNRSSKVPGNKKVSLLVAMHTSLTSSRGGAEQALQHVVRSVNVADSAFRLIGLQVVLRHKVLVSNGSREHLVEQAMHFYQNKSRLEDVFLFFTQFPDFNVSHGSCNKVVLVNLNVSQEGKEQAWSLATDVIHAIGHALGLQDDEETDCKECVASQGVCVMNSKSLNRGVLFSKCSVDRLTELLSSNSSTCQPKLHDDVLMETSWPSTKKPVRSTIITILYVFVSLCSLLTLAAVSWCIMKEIGWRRRAFLVQRHLFSRRDERRHSLP